MDTGFCSMEPKLFRKLSGDRIQSAKLRQRPILAPSMRKKGDVAATLRGFELVSGFVHAQDWEVRAKNSIVTLDFLSLRTTHMLMPDNLLY